MDNDIVYFVAVTSGTIALAYFFVSNITFKKNKSITLTNVLFLKADASVHKREHGLYRKSSG